MFGFVESWWTFIYFFILFFVPVWKDCNHCFIEKMFPINLPLSFVPGSQSVQGLFAHHNLSTVAAARTLEAPLDRHYHYSSLPFPPPNLAPLLAHTQNFSEMSLVRLAEPLMESVYGRSSTFITFRNQLPSFLRWRYQVWCCSKKKKHSRQTRNIKPCHVACAREIDCN